MKLTNLQEAKYADERKGSLNWFLKNFFDQDRTEEYEQGTAYEYVVKEKFQIFGRGYQIHSVIVYPNDDYEVTVIRDNNIAKRHIPPEDWMVFKRELIWSPTTGLQSP